MPFSMKNTTNKALLQEKIHHAAFRLAGVMEWQSVSLWMVADEAGLDVAVVRDLYPDQNILLQNIVQHMDDGILADFSYDPACSCKDRLFDVLMERFDAMNVNRTAHLSFLRSFGWVQCDKPRHIKLYVQSLERYMRAAGLETDGLAGMGRVAAFSLAYLYVLYKWAMDDTQDLSPTMAVLDQMLGRLEWLQDFIRSRYYQSA